MCKTFPRNAWERRGGSVGEVFAMQGSEDLNLCSDFQHPYKKLIVVAYVATPVWEGRQKWLPGPC